MLRIRLSVHVIPIGLAIYRNVFVMNGTSAAEEEEVQDADNDN